MTQMRTLLLLSVCFLLASTSAMAETAPGTLADVSVSGPLGIYHGPGGSPGVEFEFKIGLTVNAIGLGESIDEALANALATLRKEYAVLSYVITDSFCTTLEREPWEPAGQPWTICTVSIRARVLRVGIIVK